MRNLLAALAVGSIIAASGAAEISRAAAVQRPDRPGAQQIRVAGVEKAAVPPQWRMLGTYCGKCHNATDWDGGIAFDTMQPGHVAQDAKVWEAAVGKLQGRLMPPPGQKQPDQATVDSFVSWLESHLDQAAQTDPDPGYVKLHRLNRTEYARSVHEILGIDVDVKALLPKDTLADGFDDIADVLKASPTFVDQYITAASTVAALAVGDPRAPTRTATLSPPRHDQSFHIEGLPLGTRGGFVVEHDFPADGTYEIDLGGGRRGPYIGDLQFRQRLLLLIDGQKVFEQALGGYADAKEADQHRVEWARELSHRLQHIRVHVSAGPHRIGVAFVERSLDESDEWLQPFDPRGGLARIGGISGLQVVGPFHPSGVADTPSRRRIFVCRPAAESEELPCARRIIAKLERAAYRRPITDADVAAPLRFFTEGRRGATFDAGIENAIVAILSSPKFLFRMERTPPGLGPGATFRVSDVELASRLSFFLWSEGPDEELLETAQAGRLHEPKALAAEVRRMLADPRAQSLVTGFAFAWLQVDDMDKVKPDPTVYPDFDEDLRSAFKEEMRRFLASVLLGDHDVCDLLTADYTFVNGRLALHYGIPGVRGDQFRRVVLEDPNRWGLLGKGAILMGTSYGNRTAPVLRGAWVFDDIIGESPHAPPPSIPALKENVPGAKPLTIRQRMIMHRATPSCNTCHGLMDPIGLALENFDAIGRWRTKDYDTGTPIDASGEMAGGFAVDGPVDVRRALMTRPAQFVQTLTAKLMTFALGRTLDYRDMPTVRAIVRDAARDRYRFSSIVRGIVESPEFQMQRIPGGKGAARPGLMTTQAANLR